MRTLRRHRTSIGWFAMVAMLCNLTAAILCAVQSGQRVAADAGGWPAMLVICSEHGSMTVPADDGGVPADPAKPCQFCLVAAALALAAVFVLLGASLAPARRLGFSAVFLQTFAGALRRAGLGSRAPPRLA
jgi:hypothetical protein